MTKILITTDLSDESVRAFAPAADLARALGAEVELLTIVEDLKIPAHGAPLAPPQSAPDLAESERAARTRVDELAAAIPLDEVTTHVAVADDIVDAIVQRAQDIDAAFIAMSTHGRTGWRHLLLGSVAEAVLRHATIPVVVFPRAESDG